MAFPLGAMLSGDPVRSGQQTYQTAIDQAGQQAAGNFLQQMFNAPMPGAQPMGMPPQAQASPMGSLRQGLQNIPGIGPLLGGGQQQSQQMGGGQPQGGPPAMSMAPPQAQAQARPQPQQMQPQSGGQNPISTMSFPQIVQGLVRANPGAPPAQIFSALRQMAPAITPFMNAEALAQYRNTMASQGQQRIDETVRRDTLTAQGRSANLGEREYRDDYYAWQARNKQRVDSGGDALDPNDPPPQRQGPPPQAPGPPQARPQPGSQAQGQTWTPQPRPGYGPPPVGQQPQPGPQPGPPAAAGARPVAPPTAQPQPQAAVDPMANARARLAGGLQRAYAGGVDQGVYTPSRGQPQPIPPAPPAAAPAAAAPSAAAAPAGPAPPPSIPRSGSLPAGAAPVVQTDRPAVTPVTFATDRGSSETRESNNIVNQLDKAQTYQSKSLAWKANPELIRSIAEYRQAPLSQNKPANKAIMREVEKYSNDVLHELYDGNAFNTRKGVESHFASGVESRRLTAINAVVGHFEVLNDAAKVLQEAMMGKQMGVSGMPGAGVVADIPALRRISSVIAKEFGWKGPMAFEAVRDIVADEVVKAIVINGGGVTDRQEIRNRISVAQSPQQLIEVMDRYKQLMAGQAIALKQQYTAGGGRKDFDKEFLTDATRAVITVPRKAEQPTPTYGGPQE